MSATVSIIILVNLICITWLLVVLIAVVKVGNKIYMDEKEAYRRGYEAGVMSCRNP